MKDRRSARRYDLSLPVIIHAPILKGAVSRIGQTRDISTRGVYFTIENNLSVGAKLDITVPFPTELTRGNKVSIRALGEALRLEKRSENGDQMVGVAAVFEMCQIVKKHAAGAALS
jgi:PilZ domain-containing protein